MQKQISIFRFLSVFIFSYVILTSDILYAQHQIRHYDVDCVNPGYDYGRSIINRVDKGYGIAGYSYQIPACIGSYDWMFLKLRDDGLVDCVRLLGNTQDDKSYSLIQALNDSGYVLAGYTTNPAPPYRKKATMMKLNKNCNLSYARAIFDSLNSNYYQVVKDPIGGWGFTGYIEHNVTAGTNRNKILASQYAQSGALLWAAKYVSPGLSKEEAHSICFQPVSGTYCLAAKTNFYSGSPSVYDIMLVKLNYGGGVIWKKVYKLSLPTATPYPNTEPRKVIPMPDGGFVVVGFTNALGSAQNDIIVFRVASNGLLMWSRTYGSSAYFEEGESIALDGANLVITGSRRVASPPGAPDAFILKITTGGSAPIWTRIWDNDNPTDAGFDIINSMTGTTTPGYAVTGHTTRPVVSNDAFLWRVNSNGKVSGVTSPCEDSVLMSYQNNVHKLDSFQLIPFTLNDITRPVTQSTPASTVTTLCLGTSSSPFEGIEEKDSRDIKQYALKQNSPNPFNPSTTISFDLPLSGFTTLKVFDISGRLVSTLVNEFRINGRHNVNFDGSHLSSGAYYYKIESEGFTDIKKMILIK